MANFISGGTPGALTVEELENEYVTNTTVVTQTTVPDGNTRTVDGNKGLLVVGSLEINGTLDVKDDAAVKVI